MNDNVPFASNVPLKKQEERQLRSQARLFGNVQFIYELILAQLELRSLGAVFEMNDEFSSFSLLNVEEYYLFGLIFRWRFQRTRSLSQNL